jgi:hypothetical protein
LTVQRDIEPDDVVLIRGRAIAVHPEQRLVCVRIAEPTAFGGPGFRTDVLSLDAIAGIDESPPSDRARVPHPAGR